MKAQQVVGDGGNGWHNIDDNGWRELSNRDGWRDSNAARATKRQQSTSNGGNRWCDGSVTKSAMDGTMAMGWQQWQKQWKGQWQCNGNNGNDNERCGRAMVMAAMVGASKQRRWTAQRQRDGSAMEGAMAIQGNGDGRRCGGSNGNRGNGQGNGKLMMTRRRQQKW